jgi:hypothetical protein
LAAYQYWPHIDAIETALETAFEARDDGRREMRRRARAGAMAYDADRVTGEYWLPALEQLGQKLGALHG